MLSGKNTATRRWRSLYLPYRFILKTEQVLHFYMNLLHNTTRTNTARNMRLTYPNTLGLTQHYFTQPSEDTLHVWKHVDTICNTGPVACKIFSHSLQRFFLHFSDSSLSTYSRRTHPTIITHAVGSLKFAWSLSALVWRGKFSRGKEKFRHD